MKMKIKMFKSWLLLFVVVGFYACNEEKLDPGNQNVQDTKQIVLSKSNVDKTMFNLFSSTFKDDFSGRRSSNQSISKVFRSREAAARTAEGWNTCGDVRFSDNGDGTWTVIMDFGDGCTDNSKMYSGIVSVTGQETDNGGTFKIRFEDFSEINMSDSIPGDSAQNAASTLNGYYSGTWSMDFETPSDTVGNDSTNFNYTESFDAKLEIKYAGGGKDKFTLNGDLHSSQSEMVVDSYHFDGTTAAGEDFNGTVVSPLIFRYSCFNSQTYVQGKENWKVNGNLFVVDYGQGECDNKLTIFQNGTITVIDLDNP